MVLVDRIAMLEAEDGEPVPWIDREVEEPPGEEGLLLNVSLAYLEVPVREAGKELL